MVTRMLIPAVVLVLLILTVAILRRSVRSGSSATSVATQSLTLERKLEVLADCGFRLSEPFTSEDLLKSWPREKLEKPGFETLLLGLGMTEAQEPWRNHCVNLWCFDTECIEDHGDYKRIAERMVEMAQGSLVLENIEDYVDVDEGTAWLSFSFQGRPVKIECKVEDDWVDADVFATFVELLAAADSSKIFICYELGGQEVLIGCVTKTAFKKLNDLGIKFVPLT